MILAAVLITTAGCSIPQEDAMDKYVERAEFRALMPQSVPEDWFLLTVATLEGPADSFEMLELQYVKDDPNGEEAHRTDETSSDQTDTDPPQTREILIICAGTERADCANDAATRAVIERPGNEPTDVATELEISYGCASESCSIDEQSWKSEWIANYEKPAPNLEQASAQLFPT